MKDYRLWNYRQPFWNDSKIYGTFIKLTLQETDTEVFISTENSKETYGWVIIHGHAEQINSTKSYQVDDQKMWWLYKKMKRNLNNYDNWEIEVSNAVF